MALEDERNNATEGTADAATDNTPDNIGASGNPGENVGSLTKEETGKAENSENETGGGSASSDEKKKLEATPASTEKPNEPPVPRDIDRQRVLQPPVDGVSIENSGSSCFLNIRRKISAEELRLVKKWMDENADDLILENRYKVNAVSISVRNGKVAIDKAFVDAVKAISDFDYFEYNTGSIEVADNQSRDILPELFKDASHIHTWGSTEELEEVKSGVLVKHLSGVYGKVFSFGTQDSKYNAEKKTFTNRVTEIGGLSGIESINVIQTGSGATVAKENAFSNNLVDLNEERRDESLSHVRDMHTLTTSYEYSADYGKAFAGLIKFNKEDFAAYIKEIDEKPAAELEESENIIHRWKRANEKALDAYARSAGYTKTITDENGVEVVKSDIDSLMHDIAKDFSKDVVLDSKKLTDDSVVAKAYNIDEKDPGFDKKIEYLKTTFGDDIQFAEAIEKDGNIRRLIAIAEAYEKDKLIWKKETPAPPTPAEGENTDEFTSFMPNDGETVDDKAPDVKEDKEKTKTVPLDGSHTDDEIKEDEAPEVDIAPEVGAEDSTLPPYDGSEEKENAGAGKEEEKSGEKADDINDKGPAVSRLEDDKAEALINYRKLAWMQSFKRLPSCLYTETRTYKDGRKEVFENVPRYSDKENYLASEERDISFKIKTIAGDFRSKKKLQDAIESTEISWNDKNKEISKISADIKGKEGENAKAHKDEIKELNAEREHLQKDLEKIEAHKDFLQKALDEFSRVSLMQTRNISFEMYRAFCTAEKMDEQALGGTFVNRGNMSAKGAALAGRDWKIVNDPIRTEAMLLNMAGRIEAECAKLYTEFNSMVAKNEFEGKLVNPEDLAKTTNAFASAALSFEKFKEKHKEVTENKAAAEAAWHEAFNKVAGEADGNINTSATLRAASESSDFKNAYSEYTKSMAELTGMASSTSRELAVALKGLGDNLKPEVKQAVLDNLCGEDGCISINFEDVEGFLPMNMSQRVSLFESLIKDPGSTLCVGQGTAHDFGAYAETRGIKSFVEYTDEAYIDEFKKGQLEAKETKFQIRKYLDDLLTQITNGKLTNSENFKLDEFKEEINKRVGHMAGASDLIGIVEQKYTEYDKANAWDKLYPTFEDYVALQCEKGIRLKAEWDKKKEEETKVNANPEATQDDKRDAKLLSEAAKKEYEDFKLSRKTRLSTHMFQNSDNERVSADFCYHENEREIFKNDRSTKPLELTSRNGGLTEITGEEKEIKALSSREYWAARWSLIKSGIKKGVSTFIESFRNMSVTEAVLQILLANLLLAHKVVSIAKKGILYGYNKAEADTIAGKRAVLGLFVEGDFEQIKDEKGRVVELKIKKEALERVAQTGVTLYKDTNGAQRFRVDLSKASGGKLSGSADFSVRAVKDLKNSDEAKAKEKELGEKEEKARAFVRKVDNKRAEKETRVLDEVDRMKKEIEKDKKDEHHKEKKKLKLFKGKD